MSPFNDSVERPSVKKNVVESKPISNLVKISALGGIALGALILNNLSGYTPGEDPQRDTVTMFLGIELTEDCTSTGCIQPIAGTTENGDIYTLSGALTVGDPRTPICEISSTGAIQGSSCGISANTFSVQTSTHTTSFTVGSGSFFAIDTTSADVEAALPAASTVPGREYTFKKIDSSVNYMVLEPNGTETLDGSGSGFTNIQYDSFTIISHGGNWFIK